MRIVHAGALAAGRRDLFWDGRDANGRRLAPGIYFVAARAAGESVSSRVVLID